MLLQRWIVRALTSLTLRLSKVLRLSHRRAAQQLLPQQPWACLPHDVISRMSQDLERKQLGALRLVCKAWRRSTDDVLEHLELTRFPCETCSCCMAKATLPASKQLARP